MKVIIKKREHRIEANKMVITVELNDEVIDYRTEEKGNHFPIGDVVREYKNAGYEVEVQ